MTRVKRGAVARKRREKILKISSGFQGSSSNLFRVANQHALKALKTSYVGRKNKKRDFRSTWISRINARIRTNNFKSVDTIENKKGIQQNYNTFINKLKLSSVTLNRKVLSTLAIKDHSAFLQLQNFVSTNTMGDKNINQ